MKISAWNQYWEHEEVIDASHKNTFNKLLDYYKQSSKSFILDNEDMTNNFSFHRGSTLCSALGLGSELWFKHYVNVNIEETGNGKTKIHWNINLKILGLQIGKNAIIEECKKIAKQIA